jgi:hypothetical protein
VKTVRRFATALVWALVLATPGQAQEFRSVELQRYYRSLDQICQTGITSEIVKRYEDALRAVEAAKYGGGRDNNFFGLSSPESLYNRCFQSPGNLR